MKPERNKIINPNIIAEACKEYIDFVWSEDYNDDTASKYQHDIFEKAIELMYGNVWGKINDRI